MIYSPPTEHDLFATITHGSHLYGMSTPASDHDFKCIYLPKRRDILLAKPLKVHRHKHAPDGSIVGVHETMPPNGYEAELTPIQKFLGDYLTGQAYAVEFVFAVLQGFHKQHTTSIPLKYIEEFMQVIHRDYVHSNVTGMTGFAAKQTMDYVHRGKRLNAAREVLISVEALMQKYPNSRLDTVVPFSDMPGACLSGDQILDRIVYDTGLTIGMSINRDKVFRTLELNGRDYLETTTLPHFRAAVEKLIDQYGERTNAAAQTDVDWKSLSHAVRVYQQVLELLETKWITFPRQNAPMLLRIKQGEHTLESVKDLLEELDTQVLEAVADSTLPSVDDKFRAAAETELYELLQNFY
jgi:hypothetical protein